MGSGLFKKIQHLIEPQKMAKRKIWDQSKSIIKDASTVRVEFLEAKKREWFKTGAIVKRVEQGRAKQEEQ